MPYLGLEELQLLKVPDTIGGEADVLLGILYESLHPQHVHTLPSGLFIAKLKLASHRNLWTGVIGGPHKSFETLADQVGDVSRLMAHFVDGLKNFHSLGAPKLRGPVMDYDDVRFAKSLNLTELEDIARDAGVFDEHFSGEQLSAEDHFVEVDQTENLFSSLGCSQNSKSIQCSSCGIDAAEDLSEEIQSLPFKVGEERCFASKLDKNSEKMGGLKSLVKMQEMGITIDYRCPACRSCNDCKKAPSTERISLREEAEDQAIKDSVKIDYVNKKITCVLPLRGKESDFLSDNREIALKVLNTQCRKVQTDEEAKATVIKSFYKLFNGKFAVRFADLTEEQKMKILSKEIQHYLPWRVVYKESISTPCRTVMDASSRTPLRKDGKGGRCLNDLTVKGRILLTCSTCCFDL